MKRSDFRFFHRLRVRWAEIDMQKIVFNGHYLTYIDTAVTAYWGRLALPYETAFQLLGGGSCMSKRPRWNTMRPPSWTTISALA